MDSIIPDVGYQYFKTACNPFPFILFQYLQGSILGQKEGSVCKSSGEKGRIWALKSPIFLFAKSKVPIKAAWLVCIRPIKLGNFLAFEEAVPASVKVVIRHSFSWELSPPM